MEKIIWGIVEILGSPGAGKNGLELRMKKMK